MRKTLPTANLKKKSKSVQLVAKNLANTSIYLMTENVKKKWKSCQAVSNRAYFKFYSFLAYIFQNKSQSDSKQDLRYEMCLQTAE